MEPELPEPNEEGQLRMMALMAEIAREVASSKSTIIDSVVVDPIGELYRRCLEDQARRVVRPPLNAFGDVGVHIERFCRFLCGTPHITTVLVCHELAQKDDAAGEFLKIPFTGTKAGSETLGQKLMGMVDIVGYTGLRENEDGTKEYLAQLIPVKGRQGGDRFNCLGDCRPIDIAEWIACIEHYETTGEALPYPANGVSTSKPNADSDDTLSGSAPVEVAATA
jgi:hypothetical protein